MGMAKGQISLNLYTISQKLCTLIEKLYTIVDNYTKNLE